MKLTEVTKLETMSQFQSLNFMAFSAYRYVPSCWTSTSCLKSAAETWHSQHVEIPVHNRHKITGLNREKLR